MTISNGATSTADRTTSAELSLSLTREQSRDVREAVSRAEAYAQSHDISASGGRLAVLAVIVNRGELPFRVTNLVLSATLIAADGVETPLGNLDILTVFTNFVPYSLGPGEQQGPVNFDKDTLNLDAMAILLQNLQGLNVRVGVYELSDANGRPYAFEVGTIRARTATVSIDYGGRRETERHLVATNLDPASPGVSAWRALHEILRVPIQADPESGITSVRDVVADPRGGGRWIAHHRRKNGSDVLRTSYTAPYDFDQIVLRAGDVLRLIWVER